MASENGDIKNPESKYAYQNTLRSEFSAITDSAHAKIHLIGFMINYGVELIPMRLCMVELISITN
jgi:hypothetical protein